MGKSVENPPAAGVYLLTWPPSSWVYVGGSLDVEQRVWSHLDQLRRGVHPSFLLTKATEIYGLPSVEIPEVLCVLGTSAPVDLRDQLAKREAAWIRHFRLLRHGVVNVALPHPSHYGLSRRSRPKGRCLRGSSV